MKTFDPTVTKRLRKRKMRDGQTVEQLRWFVNYSDPDTGQRKLPSFSTKREADAFKAEVMQQVHSGVYVDRSRAPSVAEAIQHYLDNRAPEVKPSTLAGYYVVAKIITGPLLSAQGVLAKDQYRR